MRSDWREVPLSEVAELTVGYVGTMSSEYKKNGIKFLRSLNIRPFKIDFSDIKYISDEFHRKLSKSELREGDVVIVRTGQPGASAVIPANCGPMNCSDLVIIHPDKEEIDPLFLAAYINWSSGIINASLVGAVQQHFNVGAAKKMVLALPDIRIQKKISAIIGCINDKIELNNRINDNLQQQAVAIYKAWFSDCSVETGSTPWPNTTIEEITSLVVRGITPKYNDDTDQIVINQKCIRNHMIDLAPARRHLPKAITEKWLMQGDLLINSTGEGTLGRVAQVWFVPNNLTVDSHVTIVRPKSSSLRNYIGFWGLTHEKEIEALHTGSTGQTELPRERVKAMELPLPDESTLSRFNELITPMTQAIIKNQHENLRLGELRDALLPRLMSGELDVSELNL